MASLSQDSQAVPRAVRVVVRVRPLLAEERLQGARAAVHVDETGTAVA